MKVEEEGAMNPEQLEEFVHRMNLHTLFGITLDKLFDVTQGISRETFGIYTVLCVIASEDYSEELKRATRKLAEAAREMNKAVAAEIAHHRKEGL